MSFTRKTNEFLYAIFKSFIIYQIDLVSEEKEMIREIKDVTLEDQIRKIL